MIKRALIAFIALAGAANAAAQTPTLTLDDVLLSSAERYPEIIEAMAKRQAAQGRAFASRGAFDIVFDAYTESIRSGFYDGVDSGARLSQELGTLGARVYGGYRVSRGDFPIYRDEAFTNRAGEAKVGVVFSLLRDREIDRRRLAVRNADLEARLADFDLALARIGVQQQAADAYFRWIAAGRQLRVYEDLLVLAENRQSALEREIRAGARARIFLTENAQNIARRRVLTLEARQRALAEANNLSLYYRDANGAPIVPSLDALPNDRQSGAERFPASASADPSIAVFAERPDLLGLETKLEQARNRLELARNDLLPRLDLSYELSNDFGAEGLGGVSRDGVENIVGLRLSMPLQRREARGARDAAKADLAALEQRRRLQTDRAEVELRNIVLDRDMAEQRAVLVEQEVAQSEQMEAAERRRFESGASDFFLVNLREEAAASARVRLHQADFDRSVAVSTLLAATVDVEALGLGAK